MDDLRNRLVLLLSLFHVLGAINPNEILIVVSYDAYSNNYFNRNVTDFTNQLRLNSSRADYLRNVFPTKTFPNHHSIATGVYPEKHGVMANALYDFRLGRAMKYSFELFHYKSEIKPIWIMNELAGGHTGCMMWPGSDYQYDGVACSHSRHYNPSEDYLERVDEAFGWILDETKPANLIMFYIEEPDTHGHAFGTDSQKITDLIAKLNNVTEYFYKKIKLHNLENRVSVVHLSDHGMDNLELRNVIDLTKIIGNDTAKFYGSTPVLQVVPNNLDDTNSIYEKLKNEAEKQGTFKVYIETTLPKRWHFENKNRVGPITAVADLGFGFQDMFDAAKWYEKTYNITVTNTNKYGVHGYDNNYESMHPIFFAYGNKIKPKNVVKPFDTVDLFYMFCEIIGLDPPDYLQGNRNNILSVLKDSEVKRMSRWFVITISILASSALVSAMMISFKIFRTSRSSVPMYLYEEDTTILDDTKLPAYSINSSPSQSSLPSTSFQLVL